MLVADAYILFPIHEDLAHLKDCAAKYNVRSLRDTYDVPRIFGHTDARVMLVIWDKDERTSVWLGDAP